MNNMAITVIGPTPKKYPSRAVPAIVEIKRSWSDDWQKVPEMEFIRANCSTSAHDLDSCEVLYRYGILKHPWEKTDKAKYPKSYVGWWMRVMFNVENKLQQAWIGKISGEGRHVMGPSKTLSNQSITPVATGMQNFEAFGPMQMLRKICMSDSFWLVNDNEIMVDWIPDLNEKYGRVDRKQDDKFVSRSGNRSKDPVKMNTHGDEDVEIFIYGDSEVWNYRQYVEYIIAKYVDETWNGGPQWRLGGQCKVLENFTTPIRFEKVETVANILRKLIDPEYGLDFKINSTDGGFEIFVFVLAKDESTWDDWKIPGNPDTVKVYSSRTLDCLETTVVKTSAQKYGTIRVLGERIVVCCSLTTDDYRSLGYWSEPTLVGRWKLEDEQDYLNCPDLDQNISFDAYDDYRAQERFHDVFRRFGVASDWDFDKFCKHPQWDGEFHQITDSPTPIQLKARSTLTWLPLETGWDYTVTPPVNNNDDKSAAMPLRLPNVWLHDGDRWVPIENTGIAMSVLADDLGVFLHATPNGLLSGSTGEFTNYPSEWNYLKMIATVAFHSDRRMFCEKKVDNSAPSDGILEIFVPDCQLWYLAPRTVVDVDEGGELMISPSAAGCVVKNDWTRLAARMVGALARHYQERARAQIKIRGLLPWNSLLGQILTVIDEGGDTQTIEAPITSVAWINGDHPLTIISTGFARGD
jgi:hypothetical protein